jgi:hypothetical protein
MFVGNAMLYLCGRHLPRTIDVAPMRWFIRARALERSLTALSSKSLTALFRT